MPEDTMSLKAVPGLFSSKISIIPGVKQFCNVCTCICCRKVFPQRYCMTIMLVTGLTICYMQRVGLNLAIVDMVNTVNEDDEEALCPAILTDSNDTRKELSDRKFDWDEQVQSYLLLSFYFGYMIGNAIAGYFTDEYGARWFLFGGVFISTVTTCIIPPLADYTHWLWIVIARVIAGLGQSTFFPGATSLIARWIPERQKSSVAAIVMTSFTLGTIAGNVCTGFIIIWTNSWCWVYYIYSVLGLIWCMTFYFFVYSDPYTHPRVSATERRELAGIEAHKHQKVPLVRIFTDVSVWSMLIGQFSNDYTLYIVITNMPKYFTNVLNVSTKMTGTLLMCPPLACFIGSILFGLTADLCAGRQIMHKVTIRIIATLFSGPGSCFCLVLMTVLKCNLLWANIFLCMAMFLKAGFYAGVGVMGMDISKNYSGIIIGVSSTSGALAGMMAPYVIGIIATENTFPQWMLIHFVSISISLIGTLPFILFGKDERKDWDYDKTETNPNPTMNVPVCKRIWVCYRASRQTA